jgi:MFS transporter, ACDE family, multidrug resistance protein
VAPWLAGALGEQISVHLPFWVGAGAVLLAAATLLVTRKHLSHIDDPERELDELTDEATAVTVGSDS